MRLKIVRATIALDVISGKPTVITVPMDTVVTVLPGSDEGAKLIDVLWEGRAIQMFAIDLAMRGVEIRTQAANP